MQNFTTFHFEIPNERVDLIDLANFINDRISKTTSNSQMADSKTLEKLRQDGLKNLQNPKIRAVFERLKDK